jgi:hypothetical protein
VQAADKADMSAHNNLSAIVAAVSRRCKIAQSATASKAAQPLRIRLQWIARNLQRGAGTHVVCPQQRTSIAMDVHCTLGLTHVPPRLGTKIKKYREQLGASRRATRARSTNRLTSSCLRCGLQIKKYTADCTGNNDMAGHAMAAHATTHAGAPNLARDVQAQDAPHATCSRHTCTCMCMRHAEATGLDA